MIYYTLKSKLWYNMSMRKKVELSNNTIIKFWLTPVIICAIGALTYWTRQALILIFLAMFLAVAINPLVDKIATKFFHKKRVLATSIVYLGLVLAVVGVGLLVVPTISRQANAFVSRLPKILSKTIDDAKDNGFVKKFGLSGEVDKISKTIVDKKDVVIKDFSKNIFKHINSIVTKAFSVTIVLALSFLMILEGPDIMKSFWSFYDNKKIMNHHKSIAEKFYNVITTFVGGQLTVAFVNGVLASVVILILSFIFDISAGLMIPVGITIGLIGLIPMIGATLGAILAAILIMFSSVPAAIIFLIYYTIYQQIENHVIIPLVQSKSLELSVLTVLISVTVGLYLFGVLGGVLSIPMAACIKVLLQENFELHKY